MKNLTTCKDNLLVCRIFRFGEWGVTYRILQEMANGGEMSTVKDSLQVY